MLVTRSTQQPDRIYVAEDSVFVSPDGEGRIYYDSLEEAREEHGDLKVVLCHVDPFEI